jgi:hypothetical protein
MVPELRLEDLVDEPPAPAAPVNPEPQPVPVPAPGPAVAPVMTSPAEPEAAATRPEPPPARPAADPPRSPTVADVIARQEQPEPPVPPRIVTREGQFAGRKYRMFQDGSLEIDTEQSTIRFGSLDEFRAFVAQSTKRQPAPPA